jgi:enoyl-CoA hydratase/carnithine racemase
LELFMAYETIRVDVAENIQTITLHRPEKLNAFTRQMMQELVDAFRAADADDNVRAVIVTGAGRAFCSGADLSGGAGTFERSEATGRPQPRRLAEGRVDYSDVALRDGGGPVTLRIFECLKPVIGAINGPAVGIGATMLLPMDVRIAAQEARFGFVFARRGIVMEAASSWFLPRIVGPAQALEWCFRRTRSTAAVCSSAAKAKMCEKASRLFSKSGRRSFPIRYRKTCHHTFRGGRNAATNKPPDTRSDRVRLIAFPAAAP